MSPIRPSAEPGGEATADVAAPPLGRAVAVLVLLAAASMIPLLGPPAALRGTGEALAPGTSGARCAPAHGALPRPRSPWRR